jgi:hypothetical protein
MSPTPIRPRADEPILTVREADPAHISDSNHGSEFGGIDGPAGDLPFRVLR